MLDVVACPRCSGRLEPTGPTVKCTRCSTDYPILAGTPLFVADPAGYLATWRDAVLATLAEHGAADTDTVARVLALAATEPHAERRGFGDDWEPPDLPRPSPALPHDALDAHLRGLIPPAPGRALEVGCGAEPRVPGAITADLSLRAVLRSGGTERAVLDADAFHLVPESLDLIVAANLIDLLAEPDALILEAARALRPDGSLILCTPHPPPDLDAVLADVGLDIDHDADDVVWVRRLSERHVQVYLCRVVRARA